MKPMRERITEYSNGDNLDLFWRLFRLRERSGSRLVTGLLTLVLSRMARRHGGYVGKTAVIEGFLSLPRPSRRLHLPLCQNWFRLPDLSKRHHR